MHTETLSSSIGSGRRLDSWKEIAAYLGRSERTVRRWEKREGLPVHRLQHERRGSVYGYSGELDTWRESRRQLLEDEATRPNGSAPTGRHLFWVQRVATVGVIAAAVIAAVSLVYWRAAASPKAVNQEAVRMTERANLVANPGRTQLQTSIKYLEDAVRIDSSYPRAWEGLATAHIALSWFGEVPPAKTMTMARDEARQALRLDPSSIDAWRCLGWVSHYLDWDQAAAEAEFRKAIELGPEHGGALSWFSEVLLDMRRFDEALVYSRRAQDASPRWLVPVVVFGNIYYMSGDADRAISEYQRALASEPTFGLANHFLGRAYLAKGQYELAIAQLRKSNDLLGQVPFSVGDLGYGLAVGGHRDEAETIVTELIQRAQHGYYPAFAIAEIELGLGDTDQSLDWLERAAAERHMGYYLPSVDPIYDTLRTEPRFQELMNRMNLRVTAPDTRAANRH